MPSDSSSTGEGIEASEEMGFSLYASASHNDHNTEGQFDEYLDMLLDCPQTEKRMPSS